MTKQIYAVPIEGTKRLQFYNTDGSKCEKENHIDGAVNLLISYDPTEQIPVINVGYLLVICKSENEIKQWLNS